MRRGSRSLAASRHRHAQALLAPQPLNLLVVDHPTLGAGIVIGAAMTPASMLAGIVAQPLPQPTVGVLDRVTSWRVALCGPMLRDYPTREPLTEPHHPLQVVNGNATAGRA